MKTNETKLAERMRANGLKDRSLSERTGIERSIITKMRLGKIVPTLERAVLVCNHVAGLRPEDLVIKTDTREAAE